MTHGRLPLIAILGIITMLAVLPADAQQPRSGSQPEVIAAAFTAEVSGTVKSVNEKSGKLVLDTMEGPVNVRFPPDAVQGIKKGDQVTVSVGLVKAPPSASPQTTPRTK